MERQREDTAVLCEVQDWLVAGYYEDNDRSASNGKERPRWKDLLDDIKAGKIDAIAAWDQDRNWRMMSELEDLRKFFKSLDREIKLATTGQGVIDLYSPAGVMQAQVKTIVSEHEIATMRVRQLRAARQRAQSGRPKWRKAFGYLPYTGRKEDDTGVREIDPDIQQLVEAAYKAVVATSPEPTTITKIAGDWNEAGIRGLNGKPWSPSTLSMFLRSPRNAGLRDHNGEIVRDMGGNRVKGTWSPLVDEKLWDAAQVVLNGNAHGPKSVRMHLLTGILRCGRVTDDGQRCMASMGGQWVRQAGNQDAPKAYTIAYTCKTCRGVTIRAEHVTPLLMGLLVERLSRSDAKKLLRKKVYDPVERARLDAEETLLLGRLAEIAGERARGLIDGTGYQMMRDIINADLAAVERQRQDGERKRVLEDIPLGTQGVAEKIDQLSPDRLRAVFDVLATITVKPVGKGGHTFDPRRVDVDWKD